MSTRIDGNRTEPLALMAGQVLVTGEDLAREARELVVVLESIASRLPVTDPRPN